MNFLTSPHPAAALRFAAVSLILILVFSACQDNKASFVPPDHQVILHPQDTSMVLIPAGFAVLGNVPEDWPYPWGNYRLPSGQDTAWVDSFYIDRYEVSNQEYAAYLNLALGAGLITVSANHDVYDTLNHRLIEISAPEARVMYTQNPPAFFPRAGYEMTPAVMVSWYGADAFARFYGGRLPTDAEWEKAARGLSSSLGNLQGIGIGHPYPWGDEPPNSELANYGQPQGAGQSIKSYPQGMSWFGAYNMAGNVREWTATTVGSYKALRGGSYLDNAEELRTAMRHQFDPTSTYPSYGFRCASDP
jgi:iron(II)-dependent oxidoreductase